MEGTVSKKTLRLPNQGAVAASDLAGAVEDVYRKLGGILEIPPTNRNLQWDLEFDGAAVELDEYLHFNRFRAITLESSVYSLLPVFPVDLYRGFCQKYEAECLRAGAYGGKWTNKSCDSQFGIASPPKDMNGSGPSRWKQRAFYDFVKDLAPLLVDVPLARIAVWDTIDEGSRSRTVEDVLKPPKPPSATALAALVRSRARAA
jgi:hypothetical protein